MMAIKSLLKQIIRIIFRAARAGLLFVAVASILLLAVSYLKPLDLATVKWDRVRLEKGALIVDNYYDRENKTTQLVDENDRWRARIEADFENASQLLEPVAVPYGSNMEHIRDAQSQDLSLLLVIDRPASQFDALSALHDARERLHKQMAEEQRVRIFINGLQSIRQSARSTRFPLVPPAAILWSIYAVMVAPALWLNRRRRIRRGFSVLPRAGSASAIDWHVS